MTSRVSIRRQNREKARAKSSISLPIRNLQSVCNHTKPKKVMPRSNFKNSILSKNKRIQTTINNKVRIWQILTTPRINNKWAAKPKMWNNRSPFLLQPNKYNYSTSNSRNNNVDRKWGSGRPCPNVHQNRMSINIINRRIKVVSKK